MNNALVPCSTRGCPARVAAGVGKCNNCRQGKAPRPAPRRPRFLTLPLSPTCRGTGPQKDRHDD